MKALQRKRAERIMSKLAAFLSLVPFLLAAPIGQYLAHINDLIVAIFPCGMPKKKNTRLFDSKQGPDTIMGSR